MAIISSDGNKRYIGAVVGTRQHYWLDGMVDEYAIVWDMEKHEMKEIQFGYYGIDGYNLYGNEYAERDITTEVARDIIKTIKREAYGAYSLSVKEEKKAIKKGRTAEVVRGRKVPKGTKLDIFWIGERPTYQSRKWNYVDEMELIAGGFDENGNKIFIKAEYLKNLTPIKSPSAAERKKYIQAYINNAIKMYNIRNIAMGGH